MSDRRKGAAGVDRVAADYEDQWVRAMAREALGAERAPDLTAKILDRATRDRGAPPRSARGRWVAAALVLLGIAIVFALALDGARRAAANVEAQDPQARPILPLAPGTTWTYRRTLPDGAEHTVVDRVTARRRVDERTVVQVTRTEEGEDDRRYRYFSVDDGGLWEHPGAVFASEPGLGRGARAKAFPLPVGSDRDWSYSIRSQREMPEGGGAFAWNAPAPMIRYEATIVDRATEIEVPAGTFEAIHVSVGMRSDILSMTDHRDHLYWVPGIGVVLQVRKQEDAEVFRLALERFDQGRAVPPPDQRLPVLLAKDRELGARGMPEATAWIDLGEATWVIGSEFCLARWQDGTQEVLRIWGDDLVPFEPGEIEAWNALLAEEKCYTDSGLGPQAVLEAISEAAGRLVAAQDGIEVVVWQMHGVRFSATGGRMESVLRVKDGDAPTQWRITLENAGATLTGLRLDRPEGDRERGR